MKEFLFKAKGSKEWIRLSCKSSNLSELLKKAGKVGRK